MILKTFDGKEAYVSAEDAEKIAEAVNNGTKLIDLRRIKLGFIAPGAIAKIEPGGTDPHAKALPPPAPKPMSDEQRERNRKKLAEMKSNLLSGKVKK